MAAALAARKSLAVKFVFNPAVCRAASDSLCGTGLIHYHIDLKLHFEAKSSYQQLTSSCQNPHRLPASLGDFRFNFFVPLSYLEQYIKI